MPNRALTLYVLRAAVSDRLILACLALILLSVSLSFFVGGAAIVEKTQFIVVYGAGMLRFLTVGAMVLFVSFYVQRAYDQREIEFLLSRPLSRVSFILSHALAFFVLSFVLGTLALGGVTLAGLSSWSSFYLLWAGSLFIEIFLMGLVAFFFSMVLESSTVSALMTFAFYALARLSGQILGIVNDNAITWGGAILSPLAKLISVLIPRFDLMTQSAWLVYGPQAQEGGLFLLAQGGAFSLLVLSAITVDLVRRQF